MEWDAHADTRLTPAGRLLLGPARWPRERPQAEVAHQMGLTRGTVAKWHPALA